MGRRGSRAGGDHEAVSESDAQCGGKVTVRRGDVTVYCKAMQVATVVRQLHGEVGSTIGDVSGHEGLLGFAQAVVLKAEEIRLGVAREAGVPCGTLHKAVGVVKDHASRSQQDIEVVKDLNRLNHAYTALHHFDLAMLSELGCQALQIIKGRVIDVECDTLDAWYANGGSGEDGLSTSAERASSAASAFSDAGLDEERELVQEIVVPVPRVMLQEVVRQVPVPQVQTVEKIVEVPQVQMIEKVMPVPQLQVQEVVVPVVIPQEVARQVPVPQVRTVEKVVTVPQVQTVAREVPVPQVSVQEIVVPVPKKAEKAKKPVAEKVIAEQAEAEKVIAEQAEKAEQAAQAVAEKADNSETVCPEKAAADSAALRPRRLRRSKRHAAEKIGAEKAEKTKRPAVAEKAEKAVPEKAERAERIWHLMDAQVGAWADADDGKEDVALAAVVEYDEKEDVALAVAMERLHLALKTREAAEAMVVEAQAALSADDGTEEEVARAMATAEVAKLAAEEAGARLRRLMAG